MAKSDEASDHYTTGTEHRQALECTLAQHLRDHTQIDSFTQKFQLTFGGAKVAPWGGNVHHTFLGLVFISKQKQFKNIGYTFWQSILPPIHPSLSKLVLPLEGGGKRTRLFKNFCSIDISSENFLQGT